jgi:aspartate/glutamate racemase
VPIIDMLEVRAQRLHERGYSRIALFGTRFTIQIELFGALDAFDVIPPTPHEVDEIHRVYLELATAGHTSAANVEALREIARAIRRRDNVEAVVLADGGSAGLGSSSRAAPLLLVSRVSGPRPRSSGPSIAPS